METHPFPLRRSTELTETELDGEILVYDHRAKKALCLTRECSIVWRMCDGTTSIDDLLKRAQLECVQVIDESLILSAIEQLAEHDLLEQHSVRESTYVGISRSQVLRRIGLGAAAALPLIASVTAPTPAKAYGRGGDDGSGNGQGDNNGGNDGNGG